MGNAVAKLCPSNESDQATFASDSDVHDKRFEASEKLHLKYSTALFRIRDVRSYTGVIAQGMLESNFILKQLVTTANQTKKHIAYAESSIVATSVMSSAVNNIKLSKEIGLDQSEIEGYIGSESKVFDNMREKLFSEATIAQDFAAEWHVTEEEMQKIHKLNIMNEEEENSKMEYEEEEEEELKHSTVELQSLVHETEKPDRKGLLLSSKKKVNLEAEKLLSDTNFEKRRTVVEVFDPTREIEKMIV